MQKYGLWVLCVICGAPTLQADERDPALGAEFRRKLAAALTASFENIPLRDVLAGIEQSHSVLLLRDRRIDPEQSITLSSSGTSLAQFLEQLAATVGAETSVLAGAVYLGPPEAVRKLRTLIELRNSDAGNGERRLRDRLLQKRPIEWNDLDAPRAIAEDLAARADLAIGNPERIEHDLWSGRRIPDETLIVALSVLLIQFDLTFQLDPGGGRLTLVDIPERVAIEKSYTLRRVSLPVESWKKLLPGLDVATLPRRQVRVTGTVEQHERVEQFLRGQAGDESADTARLPPGTIPLSERKFTLALPQGVAAAAVMEKLRESGIQFEYDATKIKDAGIDLNTSVKFDVKDARADEFFEVLFGPLGLDTAIDGVTVTLTPSRKRE